MGHFGHQDFSWEKDYNFLNFIFQERLGFSLVWAANATAERGGFLPWGCGLICLISGCG
jgi:hypothetical protein